MSTSIIRKYTVLFTFLFPITSIGFDQPDSLPASLTAIIDGRTAGLSDEEILIHNEWTSAKLLGEFFCQEIGLRELGKKLKGADRIFIDGIEQAPKFIAKNRIAGFGSVRFQEGWKDFTYECAIDMETGDALEFIYTEASQAPAVFIKITENQFSVIGNLIVSDSFLVTEFSFPKMLVVEAG